MKLVSMLSKNKQSNPKKKRAKKDDDCPMCVVSPEVVHQLKNHKKSH
jgi:hypothetical protein